MLTFNTPLDLVRDRLPEKPVACVRPERAALATAWFQENFPGEVLYAVKANPSPWVLDAMYAAGQRWFDVASEAEIELIASRFPDAVMAYMHPVKPREAIRRAYFDHGVRIFVLDCEAELRKIVEATNGAGDLTLVVRLAVSNEDAGLPLKHKFGASAAEAPSLLQAVRRHADQLGVSFHVGSQCMNPGAYRRAMADASRVILKAAVTVDIVDVGGGFPSRYPGMNPPDLSRYVDVIDAAFEEMPVLANADLWCEPGRALVAESTSILVRVELVKDGAAYINDGAYGNLFDAAHCKWQFPLRVHRADGSTATETRAFKLYGPTCDSIDTLEGPFELPADLSEGDYIEFGMLGAYGVAMQTRFNGFGDTDDVIVRDAPWTSMFGDATAPARSGEVVAFPRRKRSRRAG
ncbi:type III PLP-dependent enzyme [bacterium]|nr:type III PLP-dependent enzyme [bacterium]